MSAGFGSRVLHPGKSTGIKAASYMINNGQRGSAPSAGGKIRGSYPFNPVLYHDSSSFL
jgi:hypothetical protein